MSAFRLTCLLIFLALSLCVAAPVRAQEDRPGATIGEVVFGKNEQAVQVSFKINDLSSEQLVKTIESGLPVRFVYLVRFVRKAGYLTSGVLTDLKFERVLEKDNLKNRYRITENDVSSDVDDFPTALLKLGNVEKLDVAPLSDLIPEKRYQVEIQVKLEEFRLPFHLHRILPFFSAWDVTTPLKTVRLPAEFGGKP